MSTFEYHHFLSAKRMQILPGLNALGKQGWEVVCREPDDIGGNYTYLLKRETPEENIAIRSDFELPPKILTVISRPVAANGDQPLPDADAAAAERTTKRLVPRDPRPWGPFSPQEVPLQPTAGTSAASL